MPNQLQSPLLGGQVVPLYNPLRGAPNASSTSFHGVVPLHVMPGQLQPPLLGGRAGPIWDAFYKIAKEVGKCSLYPFLD